MRDAVSLDATIEDAGAADIDADGTLDLVLAQTDLASSDSSCRGSTIRAYRDGDLGAGADVASDALVDSGVIGSFDASRGDDLAAYVMPVCTGETGASTSAVLRVYRLTDGTPVASLPALELDLPVGRPGIDLVGVGARSGDDPPGDRGHPEQSETGDDAPSRASSPDSVDSTSDHAWSLSHQPHRQQGSRGTKRLHVQSTRRAQRREMSRSDRSEPPR